MKDLETIYTQIIEDFNKENNPQARVQIIKKTRDLLTTLESYKQNHRFLIPFIHEIDFREVLKSQKKEWEKDKNKVNVNLKCLGISGLRNSEFQKAQIYKLFQKHLYG